MEFKNLSLYTVNNASGENSLYSGKRNAVYILLNACYVICHVVYSFMHEFYFRLVKGAVSRIQGCSCKDF